MKRNIPVEKNEDYIIDIKSMGFEGEGVGKINDFTVFIPGAILGETVKVKIVKVNKNFAFGKLMDIIKPSEYREVPLCSIYNRCGGCQLQHLSYEGQLNFKRQRVEDCITRIGKLKDVIIHPTMGMKNPYRYRNKVQLPVRMINGEIKIGFYAERSHDIIDMDICHIQEEISDKVINITKEWMKKYNIEPYNEETQKGKIRHIMIRRAFRTGEVMLVLVTNEREIPHVKEFIDAATSSLTGVVSIIQNLNFKNTNVILGEENRILWGKETITDFIGKFKFSISSLSFFQVNPVQTEILYSKALEYAELSGEETVFDAYCGTGTISLFLSEKAKKVYGVEIVPQAIENAIHNAKDNNITNAEFIVGESEKVIPELIKNGIKPNVIVVDPPRKGCDRELLEAIAEVKPERVVYVSCDPGTLARDLGILDELGFKTLEVQPVDMFPQTVHVECVARIEKKYS